MRVCTFLEVTAGHQVVARLRPGCNDLTLAQEVVVGDLHDHIARLASDTDDHLLGVLQKTLDVGSMPRNAFGLHDMHGNVWEWVEDCYQPTYRGAPADGSAVARTDCRLRVLRGGAWNYYPWALRSAYRYATPGDVRLNNAGLRVALSLR